MIATRPTPILGPALTWGFSTTIVMWCAWFGTHYPGVSLAPAAAGVIELVVFVGMMALLGRRIGRARSLAVGGTAGAISALLNLLVLGSFLTEGSGEGSSLRPSAPLALGGFVLGCAVVGGLASMIGSLTRSGDAEVRTHADWLGRFAIVTAVAVAPLLLIGGLVTSTESGMAVPDWPGTYGANMFLYPIGLMTRDRVFEEHSHRLFGALVGLTTLVLMLYTLVAGPNGRMKLYAVGLFILVVIQGVLGGVRVSENLLWLAIMHGVTAQVFFALMVAGTVLLSTRRSSAGSVDAGRLPTLGLVLLICLGVQLMLGAGFRHLYGRAEGGGGAMHMIWTHAIFAVIVAALGLMVGFIAMRGRSADGARAPYARAGHVLAATIPIQVLLGIAALVAVMLGGTRGDVPESHELAEAAAVPLYETVLTTAHQANGALMLAMATLVFVWARWSVRAGDHVVRDERVAARAVTRPAR